MNGRPTIWQQFVSGHFGLLLGTLLTMFFVLPLIHLEAGILNRVFGAFSILVLLSCIRAVSEKRSTFWAVAILGIVNALLSGMEVADLDAADHISVRLVILLLRLIYYLAVFISIMKYVLSRSPVTTDKICGAICAYFLMGIVWAVIFAVFYAVNPNSFDIPEAFMPLNDSDSWGLWTLYFSFVSLTTIGYGDITPLSPAAQTYAYLEAVCGQIFLTVLIARLVALHIIHSSTQQSPSDG